MPIALLDVILVLIMILSGLLAMLRGLTREVLTLSSWAIAALAAFFAYPLYIDAVRPYFGKPEYLADIVLIGGVFLVVLIIAWLVTMRLADRVLDSRVGAADRTLGFLFGLARGALLVVIAFELFSAITSRDNPPRWIAEARSYSFIESTGRGLISLLPDNMFGMLSRERDGDAAPVTPAPDGDRL